MKKLTVDGITFDKAKDAKAAERELEAIEKIRGRMDVTDPVYAKVLYEKLIEKEMLHTKVGDKFLAELQGYFSPEAAGLAADTGAAQDTGAAGIGEAAAEKKAETVIPYLDEAEQAGPGGSVADGEPQEGGAASAAGKPQEGGATTPGRHSQEGGATTPDRHSQEDGAAAAGRPSQEGGATAEKVQSKEAGTDWGRTDSSGVSSDTARLEGLLHRAIFEGNQDSFEGDSEVSDKIGAETENEEEQPEEYFGATGLDALVEEYDEADAAAEADQSREAQQPGNRRTEGTEKSDDADLDAFMREYGLNDAADPGTEESEKLAEADLDALMEEYGVTEAAVSNTAEPENGKPEAEQQDDEDGDTGAEELEALVDEYSENDTDLSGAEAATEPPLNLNTDGKEAGGEQEEGGFHLNLDDADLYEEEPDDATLLAQARTLQKELHQEDLSEVFTEQDNQPEKKRFSLYGVLLVSILLNIILIASMAIMVQVFKNSDNRNILNYERILEQEYQTATPSDAVTSDADVD